jgi:hypothetical protein
MFSRGICMAFSFVPVQAASYANIESADTGRASAIFSAQRQVAASLGVALLATVLVEATHHYTDGATNPAALATGSLDAFHVAFFAATIGVVFAGFSALLIRDRDAASTIRRFQDAPVSEPESAGYPGG